MSASDTATESDPEEATIDLFTEDRLPLPDKRAKRRRPIDRRYSGTYAEPRDQLRVRMDFNDIDGRWMFTAGIVDRGTVIPRQPAMLWYPYTFRDRYLFQFIDPYGNYEHVTDENLGDPVYLTVIPGPESPGFTDWYNDRFENDELENGGSPDDPLTRILF